MCVSQAHVGPEPHQQTHNLRQSPPRRHVEGGVAGVRLHVDLGVAAQQNLHVLRILIGHRVEERGPTALGVLGKKEIKTVFRT